MPDPLERTTVNNGVTVTPGVETSEYAIAKDSAFWSKVALLLGAVITIVPTIMAAVQPFTPENTKITMLAGAIVMAVSQIQNALVSMGFIKSRTDVKTASAAIKTSTTNVTTNVEKGGK